MPKKFHIKGTVVLMQTNRFQEFAFQEYFRSTGTLSYLFSYTYSIGMSSALVYGGKLFVLFENMMCLLVFKTG